MTTPKQTSIDLCLAQIRKGLRGCSVLLALAMICFFSLASAAFAHAMGSTLLLVSNKWLYLALSVAFLAFFVTAKLRLRTVRNRIHRTHSLLHKKKGIT